MYSSIAGLERKDWKGGMQDKSTLTKGPLGRLGSRLR